MINKRISQIRRFVITSIAATAIGCPFAMSYAKTPLNEVGVSSEDHQNWSGTFIGGEFGGGWGRSDYSSSEAFGSTLNTDPVLTSATFSQSMSGVLGGIQISHNWQRNGFIFGLETALDGVDFSSTSTNFFSGPVAASAAPGVLFENNVTSKTTYHWLYTLTPKIGFSFHHFLFFGKLGFGITQALIHVSAPAADYSLGANDPVPASSFSERHDLIGLDVSAGIDYLLHNWIFGAEYDYLYFGTTAFGYQNSDGVFGTSNIKTSMNSLKAIIGYKISA